MAKQTVKPKPSSLKTTKINTTIPEKMQSSKKNKSYSESIPSIKGSGLVSGVSTNDN